MKIYFLKNNKLYKHSGVTLIGKYLFEITGKWQNKTL